MVRNGLIKICKLCDIPEIFYNDFSWVKKSLSPCFILVRKGYNSCLVFSFSAFKRARKAYESTNNIVSHSEKIFVLYICFPSFKKVMKSYDSTNMVASLIISIVCVVLEDNL